MPLDVRILVLLKYISLDWNTKHWIIDEINGSNSSISLIVATNLKVLPRIYSFGLWRSFLKALLYDEIKFFTKPRSSRAVIYPSHPSYSRSGRIEGVVSLSFYSLKGGQTV